MAKYTIEKAKQIAELLATGENKIIDICKQVGIAEPTYYEWKKSKPKFLELLKEAEVERVSSFKGMARSGLAKLIDVYEYEEEHIEYKVDAIGNQVIRNRKLIKKRMMPNSAAVIFTLCNLDPENFKNIQKVDVDITTGGEQITGMIVK